MIDGIVSDADDEAPVLCGRADCRHLFADHVFEAPGDPLSGGTYHCPVLGCYCTGTWSVTAGPPAAGPAATDDSGGEPCPVSNT